MNENTLTRNCLKNFILRIDFSGTVPFDEIANAIKDMFVRREERTVKGIRMIFNPAQGDVMPIMAEDASHEDLFVKGDGSTLVLSRIDSSLVIQSLKYIDNSAYEDVLGRVVSCQWRARRVGLRYINSFSCEKNNGIAKIMKPPYAELVKKLSLGETVCRAMNVQSRITNESNINKIQFGVPNSSFPKKITRYDLLLDIDAFHVGDVESADCTALVKQLNHDAYAIFREFITDRQLGEMK